jgi:cardiolipin synthase
MLTSIPNLLTIGRVLIIPVIVALLYVPAAWASWAALAIYLGAALTDWLDGYLARRLGEVSPLGRFLDPVADKLLVTAVVVMLIANGTVGPVTALPAIAILCREILVSGLREYLAEMQVGMPVSRLAKWKTAAQMAALALLILAPASATLGVPLLLPGKVLLWVAGVLTVITGYDYLVKGLKHMRGNHPA